MKITALFFIFSMNIFAGPEKYDHLEAFKKAMVSTQGPSEEIVQGANGKTLAKAVYVYNEKKQISEIKFYNNSQMDGRNVFKYDANGLKQEELYDKNNKLVEKLIYSRNKLGQAVEFEVFDGNNVSILKWKFQYDNKGLLSGSRYINNEITEKFVNERSANEIIQRIYVDKNENPGNITVNINNSQIVKRTKVEPAGIHTIDYFYDKQGRIEKMIFSRINDSKTEVEKTHIFNYTMPMAIQPEKLTEK
ncbi:MAG: hypothetical protein OEV78_12015 [Spirochaetia bacterium]|nr:hypothetical protein [Spirochaetia bacterium]